MSRYLRTVLRTSLGGALAGLLIGCLGETRSLPVRPQAVRSAEAASERGHPGIDEEQIKRFGFQVSWDSNIRDEVITSLSLEGDQLYAFSESKRLYQVDLHSGMVNWVYDVGRELAFADTNPITEWVYQPDESGLKRYDEIFFVAQDHLYGLDKKNGSALFTTYLPFTASSPPRAGPSHVFVGSWDDRIYALRKDSPLLPAWSWNTRGDVRARPVYRSPSLFVASADGNLYAFEAASGRPRWPFETGRQLVHDPLIHRSLLYLPSDDYNLYVLGVDDGLLHYRFGAQAPLTTAPVAIDRNIYFGAGEEGVFSIVRKGLWQASEGHPRKIRHELAWQRRGAERVLCKGIKDVYLLEPSGSTRRHVVSRIDVEGGHFRDSLELTGVDYWVTNTFDPGDPIHRDRALRGGIMFLGFRNGWIVALKETATVPGA